MAADNDPLPIPGEDADAPMTRAERSRAPMASERDSRQQMRWEAAVVKRLCRVAGRPEAIQELLRDIREQTGHAQLYFSNFHRMFPEFPVWLCCVKIPYVHETDLKTLFRPADFAASKLYQFYREQADDLPPDQPYALVFEWLQAGGRFKILHQFAYSRHRRGFRMEIPVEEEGHRRVFWLENLDDFACNCGWVTHARDSGSEDPE